MNKRFQGLAARPTAVLLLILAVMLVGIIGLSRWQSAMAQIGGKSPLGQPLAYLPLIMKPLPPPLTEPVISAFDSPVFVTHMGDNRLFVLQKEGTIQTLNPDGTISMFLDIRDRVLHQAEQGLFNLVLDPDFATNGYFYVTYTGWRYTPDESWFKVARFQVINGVANPDSECGIFGVRMDNPIHVGGGLGIHPFDGRLYVGVGDDQGLLIAQADNSYKGKLVRLNINDIPDGECFSISGERIAKGLRNPWRFDFDPINGDIYIGDVNDNTWEEVNYIPYGDWGRNFAWPCMEGPDFIGFHIQAQCQSVGTGILPIHYYPHHPQCAVIGGYVLHEPGQANPQFLFGDACTRELYLLTRTGNTASVELLGTLSGTGFMLTSFGKDNQGRLYALEFPNTIYRLNLPE
jgi:glucose/arabinose dehydrogenase